MKKIPNLTIDSIVDKYLKSNDDVKIVKEKLIWIKDLLTKISKHYETKIVEISQGTINSKCGYNVYMKSQNSTGELYFRVDPNGVEFQNDKVVHEECNEELIKKVVDYCNHYFIRNEK